MFFYNQANLMDKQVVDGVRLGTIFSPQNKNFDNTVSL